MDSRLLRFYETELAFMRDMGAEFAAAYPKIAARLGMDGIEVQDPYVERLLEGVAFLSARVQLELDLQYPALTSHLLEIVYPHYLAPTPSMTIVSLGVDGRNPVLKDGLKVPRGTRMESVVDASMTPCEFRTSHDLTLWPIEIAEAEYIDNRGGLVARGVAGGVQARAGIRLRLRRVDGAPISALQLDRLRLFVHGGSVGWTLHEYLSSKVTGIAAASTDPRAAWHHVLPAATCAAVGYRSDEALLPTPRQSFDGYRLLQEYFAMPERYLFIEIDKINDGLQQAADDTVDLFLLLSEGDPELEALTQELFDPFAVPALNLFPKRCDRLILDASSVEQPVIVDRTAPLDYEVHSLTSVTGVGGDQSQDLEFRPFYSADDFTSAGDNHQAYYTQKRRMRQRSERERLRGARTSYLGSNLYLTIVDPKHAPYSPDFEQLGIRAMCTNRDLPLLLSTGGDDLFRMPDVQAIKRIRTSVPPTRPRPTLAEGDTAWRLISHLSLNYLSIADGEDGAAALRELIGIYAPSSDRVINKQLEGLQEVRTRPIVRRMSDEVLSTAVRGLEVSITFDESHYEGTSVYPLGSVLERFFRKYATINSFTETVLKTQQRGEIARWKPQVGLGRVI